MTDKTKAQALAHWASLQDRQPIKAHAISSAHKGSTYGCDGIRVEGSPEFIDAVLSHLKPLLAYENGATRLGLSYVSVKPAFGKTYAGDHVCYVKIHQRGPQAVQMNRMCGKVAA